MKGTIITGIPDIEKYDYIAESPDENNFKVYSISSALHIGRASSSVSWHL